MIKSEIQGIIPAKEQMKSEIAASHARSNSFDISSARRNSEQEKLSTTDLEARRERNRNLLNVVNAHIQEFYSLVSRNDFIMGFADGEGYILELEGSENLVEKFGERNCKVGYRWTERDVGTTAISLCLERQLAVQLTDEDHFCKQAHGFTSSAAPVIGKDGILAGVLVVSGAGHMVHSHTLIMVTMTARSIEKQLRLLRRHREMSLYSGFLNRVIESAETGMLTLDTEMRIRKTNEKGKTILKNAALDGKPVSILRGLNLNLEDIHRTPARWKEKEARLKVGSKDVHCYYSAKPVVSDNNELLGAVMVFEEFDNLRKLANRISGTEPIFTFDLLVGKSPQFLEAVELGIRASQSSSTVLLQGETGTGKELFAQSIHNAGKRVEHSFVPINCGAIPGELLESELFGYVDGAFTGASRKGRPGKFELADGGTILLDEIGDMPHDMQVKLLRVLQTGEVHRIGGRKVVNTDARVIAATHVNLLDLIEKKRFRSDLYYRLNIIRITIPPLRERGAKDIELLAHHFVNRYSSGCKINPCAMDMLVKYEWPGNVRELENCIQRAIHLSKDKQLTAKHLGLPLNSKKTAASKTGTLREMEQQLIADTLAQNRGNMVRTAKALGISRATLYRKVNDYGL